MLLLLGNFHPEPGKIGERQEVGAVWLEDWHYNVQGASDGQILLALQEGVFAAPADVQAGHVHPFERSGRVVHPHEAFPGRHVAPAELPRARRLLEHPHHVRAELRLKILGCPFALKFLLLCLLCVAGRTY